MHCPQCSAPVTDSQAIFCPRCGTRLSKPVSQPVAAPTTGWEAVPPRSHIDPSQPSPQGARRIDRSFFVKVAVCALIGAIMLGWATYVTAILDRIPDMMRVSFEHYQYDPTGPPTDFQWVLHHDPGDAWVGALFGLLIGLVVSVLWLAPSKSE